MSDIWFSPSRHADAGPQDPDAERRRDAEHLRSALEAARMEAWDWNPATDELCQSANSAAVYGLPAGTTLTTGKQFFSLVHPEDRAPLMARLREVFACGSEYVTDFRVIRPDDGSVRWMEERGRAVRDPQGNLVRIQGVTLDVTERKENERIRRESEALLERRVAEQSAALQRAQREQDDLLERYRVLAESIPQIVWIGGPDGVPLYVNPRCEEYFGYSAEAVVAGDWRWTVHPDELPAAEELFRASLEAGRPFEMEQRLRRADGEYRWHVTRAVPLRNSQGEVTRWFGSCTDIHDLKRAEGEARRASGLLRAVVDGTTDAVFVKDLEGRYLLANPATARFVGRPVEEILGKDDATLFDREGVRRIVERDRRVMESGQAETDEEHLTAAGVSRTFLATKAPYRDEAGRIVGIIGVSRDVTGRRQLEAERVALLARMQLHVERMPLAYIQLDADLRVADWNPAAERMFGFSKTEALEFASPVERIVPPSARPQVEDVFRRACAGDMSAHATNDNVTKDGRTITCEWHNIPLMEADGRFGGLLCLAQDVTERKRLEEQLRQSQKMEAVGRLAGGVAHDFNNLLTAILGYGELLAETLRDDPQAGDLVREIMKAGGRAAALTRQLLAFSRKQMLRSELLDLNDVVADLRRMLSRLIGEDVELTTDLDPRLRQVKADAGQLEQVIVNLAVNSRDAMPRGGRLTVATRNVRPVEPTTAAASRGEFVVLSVSDTGCGMDAETLEHIYEPFFTTKGPGRGTGLGLPTVYGIVEQSGGRIEVRSEVGKGTTLDIYFPAAEELSLKGEGGAAPNRPPRGTETVLLVEDEEAVRSLAGRQLRSLGYEVLSAVDGAAALQIIRDRADPIDLLVTDVVMPGMSGRELAERLRTLHPGTKVLFMSGYTDDAVVRHGVSEEEVPFLQKPFSLATLAVKVRQVLRATKLS